MATLKEILHEIFVTGVVQNEDMRDKINLFNEDFIDDFEAINEVYEILRSGSNLEQQKKELKLLFENHSYDVPEAIKSIMPNQVRRRRTQRSSIAASFASKVEEQSKPTEEPQPLDGEKIVNPIKEIVKEKFRKLLFYFSDNKDAQQLIIARFFQSYLLPEIQQILGSEWVEDKLFEYKQFAKEYRIRLIKGSFTDEEKLVQKIQEEFLPDSQPVPPQTQFFFEAICNTSPEDLLSLIGIVDNTDRLMPEYCDWIDHIKSKIFNSKKIEIEQKNKFFKGMREQCYDYCLYKSLITLFKGKEEGIQNLMKKLSNTQTKLLSQAMTSYVGNKIPSYTNSLSI